MGRVKTKGTRRQKRRFVKDKSGNKRLNKRGWKKLTDTDSREMLKEG